MLGSFGPLPTRVSRSWPHLGLRPQSGRIIGWLQGPGADRQQASEIVDLAGMMAAAGAVAILLEAVPAEVAKPWSTRWTFRSSAAALARLSRVRRRDARSLGLSRACAAVCAKARRLGDAGDRVFPGIRAARGNREISRPRARI